MGRSNWFVSLVFVLALSMTACQPVMPESAVMAQSDNGDDAIEVIRATSASLPEVYAQGNAALYATHYTADAIVMAPNAPPIEGRADIQEFWQGALDAGISGFTVEILEIEVFGDTAIEVGVGELLMGEELLDDFKYLYVWKERDGAWLLHRDIWNSNAPAAEASATDTPADAPAEPVLSDNVTVFATGLDNPRGLRFGPDGALYVAEGGRGGTTTTTAEECEQVPAPIGPYSGGMTARISKIDNAGNISTVADGLPSNQTSADSGSLVSGVSDVVFVGDTLYALISSAGCSHGLSGTANGVYAVNDDGSLTMIADLSAYYQANHTAHISPGDFEPDGEPYNFIEVDGDLYVVEPNRGSLEKVTLEGEITRIIDISATEGHSVPTSAAYRGNFFIGNLTTFPIFAGAAEIMEVTPEGEIVHAIAGLTAVLAVAFDDQGRLYALETTTVDQQLPVPGTGRVVRVDMETGTIEQIASGLTFPTGMTFGPDGLLYVSNYGFGFPPGSGEILQVRIP